MHRKLHWHLTKLFTNTMLLKECLNIFIAGNITSLIRFLFHKIGKTACLVTRCILRWANIIWFQYRESAEWAEHINCVDSRRVCYHISNVLPWLTSTRRLSNVSERHHREIVFRIRFLKFRLLTIPEENQSWTWYNCEYYKQNSKTLECLKIDSYAWAKPLRHILGSFLTFEAPETSEVRTTTNRNLDALIVFVNHCRMS